ncbi:MAG: type I DNA topoisomerase [Vicingaceae bacterium]
MIKNLVIVESPAKAKTIEGFLGKDYVVKSSFGHIRDLPNKDLSVDVDNNFEPKYEIPKDKKKIVAELKKLAQEAESVWLASDEDREGEAISWHLSQALNLDENKTKRIVFHEITKNAILEAIKNPRKINKDLVDAQQARRVLDRLVGYELSPVLWKKVKPSLSAGRVQSVAVRLIVEREKEIQNFKSETYFKVVGEFTSNNKTFSAELNKRFESLEQVKTFLEKIKEAQISVGEVETKPATKSPAPPFTTSTLQQEASRKLGFSVSQTMTIAQKLYESGKITYMRTDSVNLSDLAINTSKKHIQNTFGNEYVKIRKFSNKSKGAQEAHEAIRPTYIENESIDGDNQSKKLYDLIWKRTIASQMSDAKFERTTAKLLISNLDEYFIAKGEVLKFDGFLKVYIESSDEEDNNEELEGMLPNLNKGETLTHKSITATQKYTNHPPRYTEASLVKKLEELGIGRPSTYAPTISTILKRNYVVKEDRPPSQRKVKVLVLSNNKIEEVEKTENYGAEKKKLFPTDIGIVVTDFLKEYFGRVLDYDFTAQVEQKFDEIAQGYVKWNEMIKEFYKPFHTDIEKTLEEADKAKGERVLGIDPKTGKQVVVKIGRYGPMVQIGDFDDNKDEKPKFASLQKDQSLQSITLEEALKLFELPKTLGEYNGKEVVVGIGRFGPYVRYNNDFISLKNTDETPQSITLQKAIDLIEAKKEEVKNKFIKVFENEDIQVLNGRYGPYIKSGKKNYKIPKSMDPHALTLEDCKSIIEKSSK